METLKNSRLVTGDCETVGNFLLERIKNRVGLWLVTLNFEMVARALRDGSYEKLLDAADFFVADGVPIAVYSSWVSGKRVKRVPGVDLLSWILGRSEVKRVLVIGGLSPEGLRSRLGVADRQWMICGGKIGKDGAGVDWNSVQSFEPHLIVVALGVPKQDHLSLYVRDRFPAAVVLGVGGAVDFLTGEKTRAPQWVQAVGFEWLHRLLTEPGRLAKRYLCEYPAGFLRLLFRWLTHRAKT